MASSVTPLSGINLAITVPVSFAYTAGSTAISIPAIGPLGTEVFGSDGKIYVLGQAAASITASTAVCTVSPTTFQVTATGGAYTSPAVTLSTGDFAWFSKASV